MMKARRLVMVGLALAVVLGIDAMQRSQQPVVTAPQAQWQEAEADAGDCTWSRGSRQVLPMPAGVKAAHASHLLVLPSTHQSFNLEQPLREARDAFERAYFEYHLAQENGSMTRVADKTGLERTHLYRKLKQLGVDLSKAKRAA